MKAWKETPFAELLVDTKDGEWGDGEQTVGSREALIIRGTDFADLNDPAAEFPRRWIKDHLLERKRLRAGDIILETAGGTSSQSTGRSALLKASFFAQHPDIPVLCASFSRHLRLDPTRYSSRFIYYLLQGLYRYGYMAVFNIQHTGVSRFQFTTFKNHTKLQIPGLDVQDKIAAILTAYDDLIEANQRRIALLERMAEEIYREWFVRLRFPGHEETKFIRGVPICWEIMSLDQLYNTSSGGTPSRERPEYYDGEVPWIKTGELQNGFVFEAEESISLSGVENSSAKVFPKGTVLVAMYGATIGQLGILAIEAATNQACCALLPKQSRLGRTFTFHLLRSIKDWFVTVSFGGAQQNISQDVIRRCKVRIPTTELILKFCEATEPLYSTIEILSRQIAVLTRTRDLLLPRLISGKLRVDELAIQFPPSMAAVDAS